jgi:branched-chain amino acid transport system substrate-binding protein
MDQRANILNTGWTQQAARLAAAIMILTTSVPARAEIVIAVAGPTQGREAQRTQNMTAVAQTSAETVNANGGINGEPLKVINVDDGCQRDTAETVARDLVARKVALVLGHPCTNAALAAADIYAKANTLFIATATRHPTLTRKREGSSIFRLSGRDDRQGETAGRILARDAIEGPVAIVHDRTQYARALAEDAEATLRRSGAAAPITATIIGGDKDYKLVLKKVKGARSIFFAGFPMEAGFLFAALRDAGSTATFIGSDSLATHEFATTFANKARGVRVLVSSAAKMDFGGTSQHHDIDASYTHAAIQVFAAAATRAGQNDGAQILMALRSHTFATSIGPISFDGSGDANMPSYDVIEWQGDTWTRAAQSHP